VSPVMTISRTKVKYLWVDRKRPQIRLEKDFSRP
jgi:hypothetical protein